MHKLKEKIKHSNIHAFIDESNKYTDREWLRPKQERRNLDRPVVNLHFVSETRHSQYSVFDIHTQSWFLIKIMLLKKL